MCCRQVRRTTANYECGGGGGGGGGRWQPSLPSVASAAAVTPSIAAKCDHLCSKLAVRGGTADKPPKKSQGRKLFERFFPRKETTPPPPPTTTITTTAATTSDTTQRRRPPPVAALKVARPGKVRDERDKLERLTRGIIAGVLVLVVGTDNWQY